MTNSEKNNEKKEGKIFNKIILFLIVGVVLAISYEYYKRAAKKELARQELSKFENIESEIFDLGEGQDHAGHAGSAGYEKLDESKLAEMSVNELREGGAEFIYQLLIYNQVQISSLKTEMAGLKGEFRKYKSQEKLQKMILVYVNLRQKIYQGKNYNKSLENLRLLSLGDKTLREKVENLKDSLENFHDYEFLKKEFRDLIPQLIAAKNHDKDGGFFEKTRFHLSRIVTVRKLNESDLSIDGSVSRIEKALRNENCKNALKEIDAMEEKYKKILAKFYEELKASCEVSKADEEILLYLEDLSLSSN